IFSSLHLRLWICCNRLSRRFSLSSLLFKFSMIGSRCMFICVSYLRRFIKFYVIFSTVLCVVICVVGIQFTVTWWYLVHSFLAILCGPDRYHQVICLAIIASI